MDDKNRCEIERSNFGTTIKRETRRGRKRKQKTFEHDATHHEANELCSPSHVPTKHNCQNLNEGTSHVKKSPLPSTTPEISMVVGPSAELSNNVELSELDIKLELPELSNTLELPELSIKLELPELSDNNKLCETIIKVEPTHKVDTSVEMPEISVAVPGVNNDLVSSSSELRLKMEPDLVDEPSTSYGNDLVSDGLSIRIDTVSNNLESSSELSTGVEFIEDTGVPLQEYEFVDCMKIKEPSDIIEQGTQLESDDCPIATNQQPMGENSVSVSKPQNTTLGNFFTFKRKEQKLNFSVSMNYPEHWFRSCKCKNVFNSIDEFTKHKCQNVEVKTEFKVWKCDDCGSIFKTIAGLKCHKQNYIAHVRHKNSYEFYEHMCMYHVKFYEKRIISLSLLIEVVENNPKSVICYVCLECNSFLPKEDWFHSHVKAKHRCDGSDYVLRCKLCMKCHVDVEKMESHLKKVHGEHWCHVVDEKIPYCCVMCEKLFMMNVKYLNQSVDLKHIEVTRIVDNAVRFTYRIKPPISDDHFSRNYACTLCGPGLYFNTEQDLNLHLKTTNIDCAFRTCSCHEKCYNMNQYYQHCKDGCKTEELNFEKFQQENSVSDTKCEICSINLGNNCNLKIHESVTHYMKMLKSTKLTNGKYCCLICKVQFSTEILLNAHVPYSMYFWKQRVSQSIAKCSILSKPRNMNQTCKLCHLSVKSKSEYENHISNDHYAQLMFCTHCHSNVKINSNAITHFKICNRPSLKEDRLFSCPLCGLRFESFHTLVNHIVIDMLVLPKEKFQCKNCFNYFFTQYNLCAHMINGDC